MLALLTLLLTSAAAAPAPTLPACPETDALAAFTRRAIDPPRRAPGWQPAPASEREALAASIAAAAKGDLEAARARAEAAGYALCAGAVGDAPVLRWTPPGGSGRPRLMVRTGPALPYHVQAPHAFYDKGTRRQAVAIFRDGGARALLVSGVHRCTSNKPSGCSGYTLACGKPARYPASDMAHNLETQFQAAHRALTAAWPGDAVVNLHGFAEPGVSVGDGTRAPITADAPAARVAAELKATLKKTRVTTCNAWPGGPKRATRRCGTHNVQGRELNGAPDACTTEATRGGGRFVHLEQSAAVRRKVAEVTGALKRAFSPPAGIPPPSTP